jgi:hypothetical protein
VGRASALLTQRAAALATVTLVAAVYYATNQYWFDLSLWWDIGWLCLLVIPLMFALVWLALPLWKEPLVYLLGGAVASLALATLLQILDLDEAATFPKLAGMTLIGWCFLQLFEELSWVVLVAVIVPWVDSYSVWRGPTKTITEQKPGVFSVLSIEFPVPGQTQGARLGLPDVLFFALFLGATARWQLRTRWTWVCLVASLGGTIALATWWEKDGLPALPLLCLGFLLPNADLLWRAVRRRGAGDARRTPA